MTWDLRTSILHFNRKLPIRRWGVGGRRQCKKLVMSTGRARHGGRKAGVVTVMIRVDSASL